MIELLISASIIALMTTLVVVRFSSFNGTALLKSFAYDIASTIREAQTRSLSVMGNTYGFDTPYGVTVSPDSDTYTLFQYTGSSDIPKYKTGEYATIHEYTAGRDLLVGDVCVLIGENEDCDIERLDMSFERPEFKTLFYALSGSGAEYTDEVVKGIIKVRTRTGDREWLVEVGLLGNVSVKSNQISDPPV